MTLAVTSQLLGHAHFYSAFMSKDIEPLVEIVILKKSES